MVVVNLVLLTILELLANTAAATIAITSLAGCPSRCGNVSVPYPFGIAPNCYMKGFNLTCNHTFRPPKLFLGKDDQQPTIEVTSISLEQALVYATNPITVAEDSKRYTTLIKPVLHGLPAYGPYTLSAEHNVFMAIGCGTLATFEDPLSGDFHAICAALCQSKESVINGSCFGIGCCQAAIPSGVKNYQIQLRVLNQTKYISNVSNMKAFLVWKDQFTFKQDYISTPNLSRSAVPIVVRWTAGKSTCRDAQKDVTSFACHSSNSQCLDNTTDTTGYICICSDGYEGNPYLPDGCQDIDECKQNVPHCKQCKNTPGAFTCLSSPSNRRKNSVLIGVIIGAILGMGLLLPLGSGALFYRKWKDRNAEKLKKKHFHQNRGLLLQQLISSHEGSTMRTKIFSLEELERATNNFDTTRILGRGGHGTVYKGILLDQRVVAIKKSKLASRTEIDQFINEVAILSQISHRNVVKLFGCCLETEVPLLVYEFISNGTLFNHIHAHDQGYSLCWEDRLKIATETASALAYMHSAASISIFHRDVKSSNILLDDNLTAKLSDFGASRSIPLNQTRITTAVQGTFGYLDPEYFYTSRLTEKSDVYSFGVILLELLTGEKPVSSMIHEEEKNLAMCFLQSLQEDSLFQLVDQTIISEGTSNEIIRVARLAEVCLSLRGEERPSMKEVELRLLELRSSMQQKQTWNTQKYKESSDMPCISRRNGLSRQYSLEIDFLWSMEQPR